MPTYRIVMHYRRSARTPVLARGIVSIEVAEIFVRALEADDAENWTDTANPIATYTIEEED